MKVKRSEIFLVDLEPVTGSEQGRIRPALVIQNDTGNMFSPTTIVAPFTSKISKKELSINVNFLPKESGLRNESTLLVNQIRVIDKRRIIKKLGALDQRTMLKVDSAIKESLGLE